MLFALKGIRERSGLTQIDAAKGINVPLSSYRNWEQLKSVPRGNTLSRVASFFNVDVDTLFGYDMDVPISSILEQEPTDGPFAKVPIFGHIAAGKPIDCDEADEQFPIPNEVMSRYPNAFLLRIEGTSMNRVLPDGCYALIDPSQKEPVDGCAYALCVNGYSATVKRVHILANGFELVPDSTDPTYRPQIFDYNEPSTETITIIGRVVWYSVPFDFEI